MLDGERVLVVAHGPAASIWRQRSSEVPQLDVALGDHRGRVRPVPPVHQDVIKRLMPPACKTIAALWVTECELTRVISYAM